MANVVMVQTGLGDGLCSDCKEWCSTVFTIDVHHPGGVSATLLVEVDHCPAQLCLACADKLKGNYEKQGVKVERLEE